MADRKKLLVITSSFPRWTDDAKGGGGFVQSLAKRLADTYDITVLAPGDAGALPQETIGRLTIVRHRQGWGARANLAYGSGMPANLGRSPWRILHLPVYMACLLRSIHQWTHDNNGALIHAHWLLPAGLAAVLYKRFVNSRVRVLITAHGSDILRFNGRAGRLLKRWVLKQSDAVSVVSAPLADTVRALGYAGPLTVCPMGVDTAEFSPERKDLPPVVGPEGTTRFVLFVGSLIKRKGIELLIDALPAVIKATPDVGLVVIGEGHDKYLMIDKAQQLGVESRIRFIGVLLHAELPAWFARAEALVLPSYSEGYPLVVMEALSSGIIPIVSPLPLFQEIQVEVPCLVLIRNWSAEAVAEAVTGVLKDKEQSQNQRRQAREYAVRRLDWKVVSEHYQDVLQRLCTSGCTSGSCTSGSCTCTSGSDLKIKDCL